MGAVCVEVAVLALGPGWQNLVAVGDGEGPSLSILFEAVALTMFYFAKLMSYLYVSICRELRNVESHPLERLIVSNFLLDFLFLLIFSISHHLDK